MRFAGSGKLFTCTVHTAHKGVFKTRTHATLAVGHRGDAKIESIFSAFSLYFFSFFDFGFSLSSPATAPRRVSGAAAVAVAADDEDGSLALTEGISPDTFKFEASPFID